MCTGSRLKEERVRLGFNQKDFSERICVSKNTQYNYEAGIRSPDAQYLAAADALGIDTHFVITGKRSITIITDGEVEILGYYKALDEPDKQVARRTLAALAGVKI